MSTVKAFFKNIDDELKAKFKQSKCLLTISVGQATHEGEIFAATMDLVGNTFGSCVLLVDDSLQRHTMALNSTKPAQAFYDVAVKEGDLWLERNFKYYNSLIIPKKIIRWDVWLNHSNFEIQRQKIKNSLKNDSAYMVVFKNSIDNFLKKYSDRLVSTVSFNADRAWQLSLDFVIEECAALCLWPELGCHYEAYPNKHNEAINETRNRFVLNEHPDLLNALTIGFRNAKQMKPQRFELLETEVI